jgi:molybdenum cofactor synthesis domain-containing protein
VAEETAGAGHHDLFEKTELNIEGIELSGADLAQVAAAVGQVFELPPDDVIVIDARPGHLALDLHRDAVDARKIVGMEAALLTALDATPGLSVNDGTTVSARGVLGWLAEDREESLAALDRVDAMRTEIDEAIARRALVLSTGPEVLHGDIEDTNQPYLIERLGEAGYRATGGGVVDDDRDLLISRLREAAGDLGYGLIVTTGGVGAEAKDHTVEAMLALDPGAHAPYVTHFDVGHGRHAKRGVRICVAHYGTAMMVALPGPHDEVVAAADVVLDGLRAARSPRQLADRLATVLRDRWRAKYQRRG